jgi:hypothetical protein
MFLQEASVMNEFVGSEHVVKLLEYDDGSALDLAPVIFMEFLKGGTLHQHRDEMKKVKYGLSQNLSYSGRKVNLSTMLAKLSSKVRIWPDVCKQLYL